MHFIGHRSFLKNTIFFRSPTLISLWCLSYVIRCEAETFRSCRKYNQITAIHFYYIKNTLNLLFIFLTQRLSLFQTHFPSNIYSHSYEKQTGSHTGKSIQKINNKLMIGVCLNLWWVHEHSKWNDDRHITEEFKIMTIN